MTSLSHKLAESLYKSSGPSAGSGPGAAPGAGTTGEAPRGDDVVDAEYTVKD